MTSHYVVPSSGGGSALNYTVPPSKETMFPIFSEFQGVSNTGTELVPTTMFGGSQATVPSNNNHLGIWTLRGSTTTADGGARVMTDPTGLFVRGGEEFEGVFQIPTTFSIAAQGRIGFFNGISATPSNDAMNYRVGHNGTNPTLTPVTRNNGTETTGTTIVIDNSWLSCTIVLNSAGNSCVFTLRNESGTVLNTQTLTTTIPINRTIGAGFLATQTTIAQTNLMFLDRVLITSSKPLAR